VCLRITAGGITIFSPEEGDGGVVCTKYKLESGWTKDEAFVAHTGILIVKRKCEFPNLELDLRTRYFRVQ
jgi:hypothetical protein